MARRRRGDLTEADRAVWAAYAAGVAPLPGKAAPPAPPAPPVVVAAAPAPLRLPSAPPRLPPPEVAVGVPPPGVDARRWRELRRGKLRPERKLDLHGLTAAAAHEAVTRFVLGARADGVRCVVIVTGKGSSPEGGILRRELPHWLNEGALRGTVLAAAHPHRANAGAVHVLLRRPR